MKRIFLASAMVLALGTFAQKKAKVSVKNTIVGFWNVENFYDTINDPTIDDEEFLPEADKKWNSEKYAIKLKNLSSAISQMGTAENPDGPAILGMAEVENKGVLEDLVATPLLKEKNYSIVHYNSPDHRGIDVAMLYNPKYFKLESSSVHHVQLPGDSAKPTRDELLVNGKLNGEMIHVLVCHWPSRRGGEKESAVNREAAAKVAKHLIDSLNKVEKNSRIILMGDLNDDPADASVKTVINTASEVKDAEKGKMYNPFESILAGGQGTLCYKGKWNLFDQIIISPALVKESNKLHFTKAGINNIPEVQEAEEKYKGQPLRTFVGKKFLAGYSDHFGTYIILN